MSSAIEAAIARVTASSHTGVELISAPPSWPSLASSSGRPHIAVLDSSYNPPTRAHLAIAATSFPAPYSTITITNTADASKSEIEDPGPYTARLLLYTPKNADKIPTAKDASAAQRAAMMVLQARALDKIVHEPIAVGLVSAATFVDKADALLSFLDSRSSHDSRNDKDNHKAVVTFLVGTDTLVRIFSPKYYPNNTIRSALERLFARAWLVSVRRGDEADLRAEEELLAMPGLKEWVEKGKVRILDRLDGLSGISSTLVRAAAGRGEEGRAELEGMLCEEVVGYVIEEGLYRS